MTEKKQPVGSDEESSAAEGQAIAASADRPGYNAAAMLGDAMRQAQAGGRYAGFFCRLEGPVLTVRMETHDFPVGEFPEALHQIRGLADAEIRRLKD